MSGYRGSIELISGLTPANNQDFPLMESHAIQVDDDGTRPAALISSGYKYAVTAWGTIIDNYKNTSTDTWNEIVHKGKYVRQVIGQYQNGDYVVCSFDGIKGSITANEAGIDYDDVANLLIGKGVRFAYSLDGGGSCETVLRDRQINPIFEGTTGRKVPTVIYFSTV